MTNLSEGSQISYKKQIALLSQSIKGWKPAAYLIGIYFLTLFVFGFTFQIILFGLTLLFWRLVLIFNPAYQLFTWILRRKDLPPFLNKPPTWYLIYTIIMMIFPIINYSCWRFCFVSCGFLFPKFCLLGYFYIKKMTVYFSSTYHLLVRYKGLYE